MKRSVTDKEQKRDDSGRVLIYCKYIVRNGKRIYPKNASCFRFWVEPKSA